MVSDGPVLVRAPAGRPVDRAAAIPGGHRAHAMYGLAGLFELVLHFIGLTLLDDRDHADAAVERAHQFGGSEVAAFGQQGEQARQLPTAGI